MTAVLFNISLSSFYIVLYSSQTKCIYYNWNISSCSFCSLFKDVFIFLFTTAVDKFGISPDDEGLWLSKEVV